MASSSSWFVLGEDEEGQGEEFNPQWNEGCFCAFLGEIICPSIQGGSLRSSAAVRTGPAEKLEEL